MAKQTRKEILLEILREGVDAWNKWREENPARKINLSDTSFREANLSGVNFNGANLADTSFREANLSKANLSGANLTESYLSDANLNRANLSRANLFRADLSGANLSEADLFEANLFRADLFEADLSEADLSEADLSRVDLNDANLREANLTGTALGRADLSRANFSKATLGDTIFGDTDLNDVVGLDETHHASPSTIGIDALQRSKGKIPVEFLRGCGLSDFEIESAKLYNPDLSNQEINDILYKIYDLRALQAIQVSPLFISYSRADDAFVNRLEIYLNEKGIRFWRDIHDAKAGRLEKQIEQAIRLNPTVLLVLSKNAIQSDWVQHEVRKARGLEKELGRDVLCPVALDDAWKESPWPERVMEQIMEYNILDFSHWEDEQVFGRMFVKLLDGLQLFYKG